LGEGRVLEDLARSRGALAIDEEDARRVRVLCKCRFGGEPIAGNHLRDGAAFLRVIDARREQLRERLGPELPAQFVPPVHAPGHPPGPGSPWRAPPVALSGRPAPASRWGGPAGWLAGRAVLSSPRPRRGRPVRRRLRTTWVPGGRPGRGPQGPPPPRSRRS